MIITWSTGNADDNMPEDILVQHARRIGRHPWWLARARLATALLARLGVDPPARVLDAGCGWGVSMTALERRGYVVDGMDISRRALEMLDRARVGRMLIQADLCKPMSVEHEPYDAVLLLDVLEHLDDDRAALDRLSVLVRPGGVMVVSVPALPKLYSTFDQIQGHRRRYLPDSLRGAFENVPLCVERVFWWGAWMLPLVVWQRRHLQVNAGQTNASANYGRFLTLPPWPLPLFLRLAYAAEEPRALAGRLASGTSLFAVAKRPRSIDEGP